MNLLIKHTDLSPLVGYAFNLLKDNVIDYRIIDKMCLAMSKFTNSVSYLHYIEFKTMESYIQVVSSSSILLKVGKLQFYRIDKKLSDQEKIEFLKKL
jgi:hypothetical protein